MKEKVTLQKIRLNFVNKVKKHLRYIFFSKIIPIIFYFNIIIKNKYFYNNNNMAWPLGTMVSKHHFRHFTFFDRASVM